MSLDKLQSFDEMPSERTIEIHKNRERLRNLNAQLRNDITAFTVAVTYLSNSIKRTFPDDEKTILDELKKNPEILNNILEIIKKMDRIFVLFGEIKIPYTKRDFKFGIKYFGSDERREAKTFRSALTYFSKYQEKLLSRHSQKSINEYKLGHPEGITRLLSQCIDIKECLIQIEKWLSK